MKKLITIFVLMSMVMAIAACNQTPGSQSTGAYEVYYEQQISPNYFTKDSRIYSWPENKDADNSPPKELVKTEKINGVDVTVNYDWTFTTSLSQTRHYYESADGKVQCVYRAKDMSLASIELREQDMSVFEDMSLEAYNQYIQNYASQYFRENWDELTLSCLTYYYEYGYESVASNVEHSFMTEFADNESLYQREFRYTKQYSGCVTTDEVKVYISFETKSIRIWFNDHQFDSFDVEIDHKSIDSAVENFFQGNLREGVTLKSWNLIRYWLMYDRGNLICRVDMKVVFKRNGLREEQGMSLIVDIPDGD